jgi:hypothetical protein
MAAFSPDADWTFRVFFSILHLVKAPSKILALLRRNLSEEQASQKLGQERDPSIQFSCFEAIKPVVETLEKNKTPPAQLQVRI